MDYIRIHGLEVLCIVGVRPRERHTPQPVRLSLALGLNLSKAGRSGRIVDTIDYARVADEVRALLEFRQYRLIEMATEEIGAMLFGCYPALETIRIRLEKPEALRGRALGTSVEIERTRGSLLPISAESDTPLQTLFESEEAGLYLLNLSDGESFRLEGPRFNHRLQWLVSGSLLANQAPLELGRPHESGDGVDFSNPGPQPASAFLCATEHPAAPEQP